MRAHGEDLLVLLKEFGPVETPLLDLKPDRASFTPIAPPQAADFQVGDVPMRGKNKIELAPANLTLGLRIIRYLCFKTWAAFTFASLR